MALYKTITVSPFTRVYIWKVTESESKLSRGIDLTTNCAARLKGMKSELHRRAFLSIRHLMAEAGYQDRDLYYDDAGKPHLTDGAHISITHSNHFTGIIISASQEVGIDIEKQRDKILRIAHKFTPIEEYSTIANREALVRKLTIVWGAKEALYKIYATHGLSFLHHIVIEDFEMNNTTNTTGEIIYHGRSTTYSISFLEFDDFTCVYAFKNA